MSQMNFHRPRAIEANLQKLMEPVSGYVAALDTIADQQAARAAAHAILDQQLRQINAAASAYLGTVSEHRAG
jgi:hypothetical protein